MSVRYIFNVWESWRRRRALNRRTRHAVEIPGLDGLYISDYDSVDLSRIVPAFQDCWRGVPADVRESLTAHWQRLRTHWQQRQTGLDLCIPIIGRFQYAQLVAAEHGFLIGVLMRARHRNGFADSGPSLMRLFASLYISLPDLSEVPQQYIATLLARTIAGYFVRVQERAGPIEFLGAVHRGIELADSWGFESDYDDWLKKRWSSEDR